MPCDKFVMSVSESSVRPQFLDLCGGAKETITPPGIVELTHFRGFLHRTKTLAGHLDSHVILSHMEVAPGYARPKHKAVLHSHGEGAHI